MISEVVVRGFPEGEVIDSQDEVIDFPLGGASSSQES